MIERAADEMPNPDAYYVLSAADGAPGLRLVAASLLPDAPHLCGRVLFCCRPPSGGSSILTDTAEILQL